MPTKFTKGIQMLSGQRLAVGVALLALVGFAAYGLVHVSKATHGNSEVSSQSRKGQQRYVPTPSEWASLNTGVERSSSTAILPSVMCSARRSGHPRAGALRHR